MAVYMKYDMSVKFASMQLILSVDFLSGDAADKPIPIDQPIYVIWSIGSISSQGLVLYHTMRTPGKYCLIIQTCSVTHRPAYICDMVNRLSQFSGLVLYHTMRTPVEYFRLSLGRDKNKCGK